MNSVSILFVPVIGWIFSFTFHKSSLWVYPHFMNEEMEAVRSSINKQMVFGNSGYLTVKTTKYLLIPLDIS